MSKAARTLARRRWAKAKREPKTCPFCGVEFPASEKQVYCTPAHQNAAAAKRWRDKHPGRRSRRQRAQAEGEGAEG